MTNLLFAALAGCTSPVDGGIDADTQGANTQWTVVTSTPASEVARGYLVLSHFDRDTSAPLVIDGAGNVIWKGETIEEPLKINRTRPGLDGDSILYSTYDRHRLADLGVVTRVDLGGAVLSTTRTVEQHHDFVEHDDGALTWLSWGYDDIALGFQPIPLASDVLRTAPEGSHDTDPEQIFSLFEDYPVEPFWSCGHMSFDNFAPDRYEWSHSNSLVFVPEEDAYYVMVRYWDSMLKIGRDGKFFWQLGGDFGDFDLPTGDVFRHAHMSDVWPGGMLLFDNGDHGESPISGVAEYAWDEETMTADKVWDYQDPEGRFISHLGDARRLPGGNTLIAWGPKGEITEITPDGEIVWEIHTSGTVGRVTWVDAFP